MTGPGFLHLFYRANGHLFLFVSSQDNNELQVKGTEQFELTQRIHSLQTRLPETAINEHA
jgi:hypothetical protein